MNLTTLYKCANKLCLTIINDNSSSIQLNSVVVVAVVVVRVCAELTSKNETGGGFVNVFRDVVEKSTFVNKSVVVVVVSIVLVGIDVDGLVVVDTVDVFIVVDDVNDVFSFSIVVEKLNSDIDDVANTFEVVVKTGH